MATAIGKVLFTPTEAAELLSLGRSTVYALLLSGELRSVTIGRSRRVPRQAIEDFVAGREATSERAQPSP